MSKNTSILLGDYFEKFIKDEVSSGRFNSASEVVRTALRLLEKEERNTKLLIKELEIGENSPKVENFDAGKYLKDLHKKHL